MSSSTGPRIENEGLVLHFDAADVKSYTGTGAVFTDRSRRRKNGSLINTPTYSSSKIKSFEFSSNKYIDIPNDTDFNTQTPSVEVWIKTNATTQNGFWFEKGSVNTQYSLFQEGTLIKWRTLAGGQSDLSVVTSTYMDTSNWYQVVGTYSSGFKRLYINSVLVSADTRSGTIPTDIVGGRIGAYGGGAPSYFYNGSLAICKVYNKALTAAEVLQNFNATKSRFNIK
jgi:hypothetical protein